MSGPIHDSVVAVPTHAGELFLCQRQPHLAAFPGYHSFPGGKVDAEDSNAPFGHPLLDAHPPKLMRALARELREEVALDLEAAVHAGAVRAIRWMGHALTPALDNRPRFDARFFQIDFAQRPDLRPHASELCSGQWRGFTDWYEADRQGRLVCVAATRRILELLAQPRPEHADGQDLRPPEPPPDQLPFFVAVAGLRMLPVPSNTLPPASTTNAFMIGDGSARRILVDPSPRDEETAARLIRTLDADGGVDEIFLTHHHGDHRERANRLAAHYGVPLGMSATTRQLIEKRSGAAWFDGVPAVRLYGDGEVLTHSLGQPVRTLAVPGHDAGQMALMPDSRGWCLVGDLIQGIGTVVVGGEEGDMRLYFESLQRVIDLAPAAIAPSHGAVLGTSFRLQETLKHRLQRERQVLALHREGRSVDEMLATIYQGTPANLLQLARVNIESHLHKLRTEGKLAA